MIAVHAVSDWEQMKRRVSELEVAFAALLRTARPEEIAAIPECVSWLATQESGTQQTKETSMTTKKAKKTPKRSVKSAKAPAGKVAKKPAAKKTSRKG